ncbi:MAG TPA: exonuclease domain-containing protein [Bacteroidota bacterium]|nr:exonuclease domain-containing protein [Bacteroidota bacterium]
MPVDFSEILDQKIAQTTFVVVDVETTGLSPRDGGITEIAMIKVRNGLLWEEYSTLVNPLMPIPFDVTSITGIDDEMVADSPTADEIAADISEFLGDGVFTAHNAPFDLGFVNSTLAKGNITPIQNPVVCTCKLARRLLPNLFSKSLGPVTKALGIQNSKRHRASGDAFATAQVLVHFLRKLEEEFEVTDLRGIMRFQ